MSFTGKIGDTLRLQDTGARHRYIILTKPNNNKNVVIVNFTTAKHHEWFVSFRPKDNKSLFTEKCTPNYDDAQLYPTDVLTKLAKLNPKECVFCPKNLTEKVVIAAFQSRRIAPEIVQELIAQYPNLAKEYYKIT